VKERSRTRKEVKVVKYTKPEVVLAGPAVQKIESHVAKGSFMPFDGNFELTTNTAYEADE
jgi:hypothetical protein